MSHAHLRDQVAAYYSGKLATHGPTPAGVDWNSSESQQLRFVQLARLWEGSGRATFVDYGCGYGALADFLSESDVLGQYTGFDVAPQMVETAVRLHARYSSMRFTSCRDDVQPADFTIASGIFNVKFDTPVDRWADYVYDTLDDMAALSVRGFAFNALTTYSDPERRRPDLFYADPSALFDRCKRRFSRFVTLVHEYPLYEFTMLVRLPGSRHG